MIGRPLLHWGTCPESVYSDRASRAADAVARSERSSRFRDSPNVESIRPARRGSGSLSARRTDATHAFRLAGHLEEGSAGDREVHRCSDWPVSFVGRRIDPASLADEFPVRQRYQIGCI